MNKYITGFKEWLRDRLLDEGTRIITDSEYVDLSFKATKANRVEVDPVVPLTREQLTMRQLGSYVPSFETIDKKPDSFKKSLALVCHNLAQTAEWQYLIEHLKQDQVNLNLFSDERKSDDFMRGSINGIYVVDEQVSLHAMAHTNPAPKPKKPAKSGDNTPA